MNNQTIMPTSSGPFSSNPSGKNRGALVVMLLIVLGLGTVIFGALTVFFSTKIITVTSDANKRVTAAATNARTDQKKLDEAATALATESPFKTYTAPEELGSFVINYPKTWSNSLDQESSGTQLQFVSTPNFFQRSFGQDQPVAARVIFQQRTKDQYLGQFSTQIKKGTIKQTDTTVDGQPAYNLVGQFIDHKTVRQVVIPVRDKVLVYSTENSQYATEFNAMLAQAKVIP